MILRSFDRYEPVHAKIERHFQTQNVVREDPQEYLKRFGEHLYDTEEVFRQARAMGVLEDLVRSEESPSNEHLTFSLESTSRICEKS